MLTLHFAPRKKPYCLAFSQPSKQLVVFIPDESPRCGWGATTGGNAYFEARARPSLRGIEVHVGAFGPEEHALEAVLAALLLVAVVVAMAAAAAATASGLQAGRQAGGGARRKGRW